MVYPLADAAPCRTVLQISKRPRPANGTALTTRRLTGLGQENGLLERQSAEDPVRRAADVCAASSLVTVCGLLTPNVLPCRRIFPPPAALTFFNQSRSAPYINRIATPALPSTSALNTVNGVR